jgi:hypothetical protein
MKKQPKKLQKWYNQRKWAAVLAVVALLAAYSIGSRALFTGSLQQYSLAIILLCLMINRVTHLMLVTLGRGQAN